MIRPIKEALLEDLGEGWVYMQPEGLLDFIREYTNQVQEEQIRICADEVGVFCDSWAPEFRYDDFLKSCARALSEVPHA